MRRLRALVLTGFTVVVLAACGSSSSGGASESGVDSVVTTVATPADVSARIIGDGSAFSLQEAVAESPVAFWFWAPGWSTCNFEAPSVEAASKKFAGKVRIVGVAWSGSNTEYMNFITRHSLTFTNVDDTAGDVYRRYEVPYQPAWVFVEKNGSTTTKLGAISDAELEDVLSGL